MGWNLREDEAIRVSLLVSPLARIERKYNLKGGEGFFGPVLRKDPDAWYFTGGSCIVDNSALLEAFEIHGAIFQKWQEHGGLAFGLPSTDETATADAIGRFNHFNDGGTSIYWTPQTGAQAIWGAIHAKWSGLGSERSYLGYPTTDEVDFAEGGRANGFQNGGIYWWSDLGAIDLRGVVVHYTGLHCFGETDSDQGSPADEPYFIIAVTTPQSATTMRSQVYSNVDGGDERPDLIEIYRGQPYGMNISSTLMEHDFADPDKYKTEVQTIVMAAHTAGTLALGLIPVAGPIIAAVVGPSLGALMPAIGEAISDAMDFGDDKIGTSMLTLTGRQMVVLAALTANSTFGGIGYKVETSLISGEGASYKGYFGIVPT